MGFLKKIKRFFKKFWYVGTYRKVKLESYQMSYSKCLQCHAQALRHSKNDEILCRDESLCPCKDNETLKDFEFYF